jgi:hypothetical protein
VEDVAEMDVAVDVADTEEDGDTILKSALSNRAVESPGLKIAKSPSV